MRVGLDDGPNDIVTFRSLSSIKFLELIDESSDGVLSGDIMDMLLISTQKPALCRVCCESIEIDGLRCWLLQIYDLSESLSRNGVA